MRLLNILVFLSILLMQIGCTTQKIPPINIVEASVVAIDSTYSFDRSLNIGDTLFLEFSNEAKLKELVKNEVLKIIKEKYKLPICISSKNFIVSRENLTPYHPN